MYTDQLVEEQKLSKYREEEITCLKSSLEEEQSKLKATLDTLETVKSMYTNTHTLSVSNIA